VIVGDTHTFGKGTVQNLHELQGKYGAIKVTINEFYRASGASTQLKGVSSDIQLPSILEDLEIGEKFYDYALPYERIKEAKHPLFAQVKPYVSKLTKRSGDRIRRDKNFKDIEKDIKEYQDKKEERTRVSLKENKDDKKDKEDDDLDFDEDADWNLEEDYYMQETTKIAADYALLMKKKTPKGDPKILGLKAKKSKKKSTKSVAKKNSDKNKKTSPTVNDRKQDKALIKKK
jgi:carboxyl-terminal processing protease